ncbi:MAG: MFS transporter [Pseudomonadota bacterium]|nr:MFS transporter [Pseudomonadota bacterium]
MNFIIIIITLIACYPAILTEIYLPSLVAMSQDLNANIHIAQSSLSVYLIGLACSQIAYGILSEHFGRKKTLLTGLVIATIGCLVCLFSPNVYVLIIGRLISGLGAGALSTLWRTIIRDSYAPEDMPNALTHIQIALTCIMPAAPAIGGYIHYYSNWRMNFAFLFIYSIILLILISTSLAESHDKQPQKTATSIAIREILSMPQFIYASLLSFIAYGCLMLLTTFAPALLIYHLQMNTIEFGWTMLSTSLLSMLLIMIFNRTIGKKIEKKSILLLSPTLLFFAGILLCLALEQYAWAVLYIIVVTIIALFAILLIFPIATTYAFERCGHVAGIAGSLYATIQLLGGSTLSGLIAYLPDNSTRVIGFTLIGCALVSLVLCKQLFSTGEQSPH